MAAYVRHLERPAAAKAKAARSKSGTSSETGDGALNSCLHVIAYGNSVIECHCWQATAMASAAPQQCVVAGVLTKQSQALHACAQLRHKCVMWS
jgi:hypothetical protein